MKISLSTLFLGFRSAFPLEAAVCCLVNLMNGSYITFSGTVPDYVKLTIVYACLIFLGVSAIFLGTSLSTHDAKLVASLSANQVAHPKREIISSHLSFLLGVCLGLILLKYSITTSLSQEISIHISDIIIRFAVITALWHLLAIILFTANLCLLIADRSKSTTQAPA